MVDKAGVVAEGPVPEGFLAVVYKAADSVLKRPLGEDCKLPLFRRVAISSP